MRRDVRRDGSQSWDACDNNIGLRGDDLPLVEIGRMRGVGDDLRDLMLNVLVRGWVWSNRVGDYNRLRAG